LWWGIRHPANDLIAALSGFIVVKEFALGLHVDYPLAIKSTAIDTLVLYDPKTVSPVGELGSIAVSRS
jgi:hypothetical protein